MLRHINPGKRLSGAVVCNGMVYVSGQVPDTAYADVATQTKEILVKIYALLAAAGTDKRNVVNASVWLSDISTFDDMNKPWEEWVAPGPAPARATVEARIANPKYRVEIAVVAAVSE